MVALKDRETIHLLINVDAELQGVGDADCYSVRQKEMRDLAHNVIRDLKCTVKDEQSAHLTNFVYSVHKCKVIKKKKVMLDFILSKTQTLHFYRIGFCAVDSVVVVYVVNMHA